MWMSGRSTAERGVLRLDRGAPTMRMFMKTLRMPVAVFSLILASVAPSSAQATLFVNGNTTFTVTWSGTWEEAPLSCPRPRSPSATGRARHS